MSAERPTLRPELVIYISLEGRPGFRIEIPQGRPREERLLEHRKLLLWLAQPGTRDRLIAAIDDVLERLPARMQERGLL